MYKDNKYDNLVAFVQVLNQEVIDLKRSKEYRIGRKVVNLFNAIRQHRIIKFIKKEKLNRKIKVVSRYQQLDNNYFDYGEYSLKYKKKYVVYSCIVGGFDKIEEPVIFFDNIDYILFTDNCKLKCKYWTVRTIPDKILQINNLTLINRYIKFHPNELFKDYDYSLYTDGNIKVMSDIRSMVNRINNNTGVAMYMHPSRNCIYDEAEVCKLIKRGDIKKLNEQTYRYRKEGFPQNFGLLEATIILSDLNNQNAFHILNAWWDEFVSSGSMRDQIALPYVLWKNNYRINEIGSLGTNLQESSMFRKTEHLIRDK